jgi:hypothetical protein
MSHEDLILLIPLHSRSRAELSERTQAGTSTRKYSSDDPEADILLLMSQLEMIEPTGDSTRDRDTRTNGRFYALQDVKV